MGAARSVVRRSGCGLVTAALLLAGCAESTDGPDSEVEHQPVALDEAHAVEDAVAATTDLGTRLLGWSQPGQGEPVNSIISPASVAIMLAMLAEGAEGTAADELDLALGASGQDRTRAYSALQAAVLDYDADPSLIQEEELPERPLLHLANHFAMDEGAEVGQSFLDALARNYAADTSRIDLAGRDSRVLDEWVSEHTGGLIDQSTIEPGPEVEFVLQNAVLLAARWQHQFSESETRPRDFHGPGATTEVDFMHQDITATYSDIDGARAVRLPYVEGFAMDVVLPAEGAQPSDVSPEYWWALDHALAGHPDTAVDLALPRIDVDTDLPLLGALEEIGLGSVISGDSLDPIVPGTEIGQAEHMAIMTVDESGTVAAAVTEVAGVTSAPPPPPNSAEMIVDRPFALRIVHEETGWPLYMGLIAQPG